MTNEMSPSATAHIALATVDELIKTLATNGCLTKGETVAITRAVVQRLENSTNREAKLATRFVRDLIVPEK